MSTIIILYPVNSLNWIPTVRLLQILGDTRTRSVFVICAHKKRHYLSSFKSRQKQQTFQEPQGDKEQNTVSITPHKFKLLHKLSDSIGMNRKDRVIHE